MPNLILLFPDQLTENIPSLVKANKRQDIVLMCELKSEFTYVKHHKKKIAFILSAMRHFKEQLTVNGFKVKYIKLDDAKNSDCLLTEVKKILKTNKCQQLIITKPADYRHWQAINTWQDKLSIQIEVYEDTRFLCSTAEFNAWAKNKNQLRMEYFYREMRKKYNILMKNGKPVGNQWNYDAENRKIPKGKINFPRHCQTNPDTITKQAIALTKKYFNNHFGDLEPFYFAVNRDQALKYLKDFIKHRLVSFGDYQDAMLTNQPWMYHSHISFYLNCGLLVPLECIQTAEQAYYAGKVAINAAEGFIRQILGWREYIRGIYWLKMPKYETYNFFNATNKLPEFYWTANTKLNCIEQCVSETKQHAYAHHIQRLMVLGNFALIAGINPDEVNEWFWIVYADAYQWVELPNVTGMSLFADGGMLASKPYASGGGYINKMSDYCKNCHYNVKIKTGAEACPFNYLYWDFLIRNRKKLQNNPRMALMYKILDKTESKQLDLIKQQSKKFMEQINTPCK